MSKLPGLSKTTKSMVRVGLVAVASTLVTSTVAAAQPTATEIIGAFCDNALFSAIIDVGFALIFIVFAVLGILQLVAATKDLNNPNKKSEGEGKAKNGGTTLLGAFLVPSAYILLGLIVPDCFSLTGAGISALGGGSAFLVPPGFVEMSTLGLLVPINLGTCTHGNDETTNEVEE